MRLRKQLESRVENGNVNSIIRDLQNYSIAKLRFVHAQIAKEQAPPGQPVTWQLYSDELFQ